MPKVPIRCAPCEQSTHGHGEPPCTGQALREKIERSARRSLDIVGLPLGARTPRAPSRGPEGQEGGRDVGAGHAELEEGVSSAAEAGVPCGLPHVAPRQEPEASAVRLGHLQVSAEFEGVGKFWGA